MKFTTKSVIVEAWAILILAGKKTLKQVPKLFNLREAVEAFLTEEAEKQQENGEN